MKKIYRFFSVLLCAVFILNLSGCLSTDENVEVQSSVERITFSWWGGNSRHEYTMDGVDAFEKLNKDIKVDCKYGVWNGYTKRQNIYVKSNEEPDVMLINYSWIKEYSPEGDGFYDIYKLADYVDLSNFTKNELSYGEVNGKLNAIPIAFNAETIYYNKDLYDKYGLELPTTWEDFFDAAKVMQKDGIYPLSMGDKALFFFVISYFEQTTGKNPCDKDGNLVLTREDIEYMLKFYKRLIDEKVIPPIEQYDRIIFFQGKTAATMAWISDADRYCSDLLDNGVNVTVGEYPVAEGAKTLGWYVKPATMYAISNSTQNPEAAAKLLNFLLNSKEMALLQKTEKGMPISDSAYEALEDENMLDGISVTANQQVSDNQDRLSVMNTVLENENVYLGFVNESTYYLYDKKTLEEVASSIYNEFYN